MIDFDHANEIALPHITSWIPGGEIQGSEYVVLNPTRNDKTPGSFKINLTTGLWIENATGESGNPVLLKSYIDGSEPKEAAQWIIDTYDPTYFRPFQPGRPPKPVWKQLQRSKKDAPEINTEWHTKTIGPESERWPLCRFIAGQWRPVMWIVRFKKKIDENSSEEDRKFKKDIPFSLWSDGDNYEWKPNRLECKYPFYGMQSLEEKTNAPVLLTEGQKAASRAEKVLPDWACVGWYGGAGNNHLTDWTMLTGREVWFWFDADAAGRKSISDIVQFSKDNYFKLHLVAPPVGSEKGFDIADAIEHWSIDEVKDWLSKPYNEDTEIERESQKNIDVVKKFEVADYFDEMKIHEIFLYEKYGPDSYFVHNKIGYLWDTSLNHWVTCTFDWISEAFDKWATGSDSYFRQLVEMNNIGCQKKDMVSASFLINRAFNRLAVYRGEYELGVENPFSNKDGVKPYWHFLNGALEIRDTGVTWYDRKDNPNIFFKKLFPMGCIKFNYDASATGAPLFMSTINRLLPDGFKEDKKSLKFILQCFAYSLMPRKMRPYYFICHGKQGSGKSSLVNVLRELAGGYFVSKQMFEVFSQFGKPGLVGKLVVCDDDLKDDYILPANIKSIIAEGECTIEQKYQQPYQAKLNVAPWIIGNRPPRITGSDGHERRAVVMHFNSTDPGDPHHMDKMFGRIEGYKDERPAILNMVLAEIPEFVKTWNFDRPEWANEAHKEWISNSNSIASYLSENREVDNERWYNRTVVYRHYAMWSELCGMKPLPATVFYSSLEGEGLPKQKKIKGNRCVCVPFAIPDLDHEEMKILKANQEFEQKYTDKVPF